jgi:hypothetical protein
MNGKVIGTGDKWFSKGDTFTVGEGEGARVLSLGFEDITHPPLHPNCRCTLIPVVGEQAIAAAAQQAGAEQAWVVEIQRQERVPPGLLRHYGYEPATEEEWAALREAVAGLPPEVRALWHNEGGTILAISPDRFTASGGRMWVVLPKDFSPEIARHEFTHRILFQRSIDDRILAYKPPVLWDHAARQADLKTRVNEDLTIMLGVFDADRDQWVANTLAISALPGRQAGELLAGGDGMTIDTARAKVDAAIRFLRHIGAIK